MAESISLLSYCTKSQQSDSIPILLPKEKRLEIEYKKKKKNLKRPKRYRFQFYKRENLDESHAKTKHMDLTER